MDLCLRVVEYEEGYEPEEYPCIRGYPTIGIGHNRKANPLTLADYEAMGVPPHGKLHLTLSQARVLLVRDVNRLVVPAAHRIFRPDLWQVMGPVRRAALGSMIFQMGEAGVRRFPNMLASIRRSDWPGAAQHAADSEWHNDPEKGTPERAARHVEAIRTNVNVWGL